MGEKDHYHHGALREAVISEALRALEIDGADAMSLRAIAESVGVSKTAPYRHFVDKHELLTSLAAEGFRMLADTLEAAYATIPVSGDAQGRIRSLFRAYVEFAKSQPALYRLMFSKLGYSLHSEACRLNSLRALGVLTQSIDEARAAGWRSSQDPRSLMLSVWAAVHGWAGLLIDGLLPEGVVGPDEDSLLFGQALLD